MQKKLIALAVVAAFSAPAFADVTMYGVADAALVNVSRDGFKSDFQAVSGGLAQSRLGAKAVEDIGDMKAVVVLEYGLDLQRNDGVGATGNALSSTVARQQMLALAGGFGTVATGYLQTTGYDWAVKFDPTAGSLVSPLQNITKGSNFLVGSAALAARAQRAVAYISPNFNGLGFAVNYSMDTGLNAASGGLGNLLVASNGVEAKTPAYLLSVNYDWNDLSVGGVYAKSSSTANKALELTDVALGASYDLKVVKLFGTYQNTKNATNGAVADKALSFSVVAPVGPGAIAASIAKSTLGKSTAPAGNQDGTSYTVAWLQGLSKVTTFYAAVSKSTNGSAGVRYGVANDVLAPSTAGGGATMIALGLNKKF